MEAEAMGQDWSHIQERALQLLASQTSSTSDMLAITGEIADQAHAIADRLEQQGDLAGVVALYEQVAEIFRQALERLPEHDRPLLEPFATFWSQTAEMKRSQIPTPSEQTERRIVEWKRTFTAKPSPTVMPDRRQWSRIERLQRARDLDRFKAKRFTSSEDQASEDRFSKK